MLQPMERPPTSRAPRLAASMMPGPPLVADLALDAERSLVTDFLQRLHEFLDVDLALAQRDFLAPGSGYLGSDGVLDVDAADVRPQDFDGPDRVALFVQDHVGRIEV